MCLVGVWPYRPASDDTNWDFWGIKNPPSIRAHVPLRSNPILFLNENTVFHVYMYSFVLVYNYLFHWLTDLIRISFNCKKQNQVEETRYKFISVAI